MSSVKVSILEKDGVELEGPEEYTLRAQDVPFDKTGTSFKKDWVRDTLIEIRGQIVYDPTTIIATLNGTTVLVQASKTLQILNGTAAGYSFMLPDATTLDKGRKFEIANTNPNAVLLKDNGGAILAVINKDDVVIATLENNSSTSGNWILLVISSIASGVQAFNVISSTLFTTNTGTDVLIPGMTITPSAGTYGVWYSSEIKISQNNKLAACVIYKDGIAVENTRRNVQGVGSNFNSDMQTLGIISLDGTQALDIRVNVNSGSLEVSQRSFLIIRLGAA